MSPAKLSGIKGKVLHKQTREIIYNLMKFMKQEGEAEKVQIPLKNFRQRILAATGISKNTFYSIVQEGNKVHSNLTPSASFKTPRQNRPRIARTIEELRQNHLDDIRQIVYNLILVEKRMPTTDLILKKVQEQGLPFKGTKSTMRNLLYGIGFEYQKIRGKRQVIIESYDVRRKRMEYLAQIKTYREQQKNIIYIGETLVNGCIKGRKKSVARGKRWVVLHAGGEAGFVRNALLLFKSEQKNSDDRLDINATNFMEWVKRQLLPNIKQNSVFIVENAACHNARLEKNVTVTSPKQEILDWLTYNNVQFDQSYTKPQLIKIVKEHQCKLPVKYVFDDYVKDAGHVVLRLPAYHHDLNPIKKIWTLVKNCVAERNVKVEDIRLLIGEKISSISKDEWANACQHVKNLEVEWMEKEHLLDDATDKMAFSNTGSSKESFSEDSEYSEFTDEEMEVCLDHEMRIFTDEMKVFTDGDMKVLIDHKTNVFTESEDEIKMEYP